MLTKYCYKKLSTVRILPFVRKCKFQLWVWLKPTFFWQKAFDRLLTPMEHLLLQKQLKLKKRILFMKVCFTKKRCSLKQSKLTTMIQKTSFMEMNLRLPWIAFCWNTSLTKIDSSRMNFLFFSMFEVRLLLFTERRICSNC